MRIPIESSTSYRGRNARPNWLALLAFIAAGYGAGALGSLFSPAWSLSGAAWYTALVKPPWAPSDRWFGPAWSAPCLCMGTAAWIIWGERYHRGRNLALAAFAVQLLLNALWAPLFFGTRSIGLGLWVSVALWLAVMWMVREFAGVRAIAACLLLPYVAWVSYAAALNLSIWRHNP